jgi:hypothetical protein
MNNKTNSLLNIKDLGDEKLPFDEIAMHSVKEDAKEAILSRMESLYNKVVSCNKALKKQGKNETMRIADVLEKIEVKNLFRIVAIEAWKDEGMIERLKVRVGEIDSVLLEGLSEIKRPRKIIS